MSLDESGESTRSVSFPSLFGSSDGTEEPDVGGLDGLDAFGLLFESLAIRDLRIYAQPLGGTVYHYRDDSGLEVDAIVELGDGRWSAFEVKLGGTGNIEKASASLRALKAKVSEQRARQLSTLKW